MRTALFLVLTACHGFALEPAEIAVVVNRMVPTSVELGEYYCKARNVPKENVISLMLPRSEEMTREEYDKFLVAPLRDKVAKDRIRCILLMRGVPLRVGAKTPNDGEKAEAARLKTMLEAAKSNATDAKGRAEYAKLQIDILQLEYRESVASVDSELMLLWWDNYPLARWVLNPLHWQAPELMRRGKPPVLMTARLDGPSDVIVRRLIDDAIAVEAVGLKGNVAIDARNIAFDPNKATENGGYGYGGYDESMRETAALFSNAKWTVTLDNTDKLFEPKSQKDVAIYCGWYSHGKFIDCCSYVKGAVAWHLASSEAVTLRKVEGYWCPGLLNAGVAVTLGPVAEPYTVGFPKPAEFFGFLATGQSTLAEVHAKSVHFASWMTTCIGDPLYNPFKKNPLLKPADVLISPKNGKSMFR